MPLHDFSSGAISELLYDATLTAAAASFDVQSIPGSYKHLRFVLQGRSDTAATATGVLVRLNNDSGANYDIQQHGSQDAAGIFSESFAATSFYAGDVTASTGEANSAGQVDCMIANYAATTFHKTLISYSFALKTTTQMACQFLGGRWRSTSAINRVTVLSQAGNFIVGTRLSIYGIN